MTMMVHVKERLPGEIRSFHAHFHAERPCSILLIGQHLKPKTRYRCLLRHISVGGAMLDFNPTLTLPPQFFLQVEGSHEELGCSAVHRSGSELGVRFNMLLSPHFIRNVIRMEFSAGAI